MMYCRQIRVEFNHCDPAGIVFYPRYFEMINSVIENFFRDIVSLPFEAMMACHEGVPTVRIDANFSAPSKLGEVLDWQLSVARNGTSALDLEIEAESAGTRRLSAHLTLVHTGGGHPQPWSQSIRARIAEFMETT